jgi:hypothetical protein
VLRNLVLNAGRCSKRWSESLGLLKSGAQSYAKPLHIVRVELLKEISDTCCIHVEDGHWFSLANGAVVHNSHPADAFRYLGVAIKEEAKKPQPARKPYEATGTAWS